MKRSLLLAAFAILTLVLWGLAFALSARALVSPWLPVGVGVMFAGLFAMPVWYRLIYPRCADRSIATRIIRIAMYAAVAVPFGMSLLLGLNEIPQSGNRQETQAVISAKYTARESEYRTVGRRRIYNGSHTVYYIELTLPDGRQKQYRVPPRTYAKSRRGRPIPVTLRRGLLGINLLDHPFL